VSDGDEGLQGKLTKRTKHLSTSALGRLGRTARIAMQTGANTFRKKGEAGESAFALADAETIEKMVLGLGELKGLAMKMGQILSYVDDSLPEESRRMLAQLQRYSSTTSWEQVEATIREDLGEPAEALLAGMERPAVASASVGQVHRAGVDGERLAVKVRHPEIDKAMEADFRAALPASLLGRVMAPGADIRSFVEEAREGFLSECDYEREARFQRHFGERFRGHPRIVIPHVFSRFCGPRVLTSAWCEGARFEDYLASDPPQSERDAIGEALYEFYVGGLYREGIFNADPHPGNLLFGSDGEVVILDHGCVRTFEPAMVARLGRLSIATQDDDVPAMRTLLEELGARPPKGDADFEVTRGLLRGFYDPLLEAGSHRVETRSPLAMSHAYEVKKKMMRINLPGRLLFLFRIRFGLHAVLSTLGARVDWQALERRLISSGP